MKNEALLHSQSKAIQEISKITLKYFNETTTSVSNVLFQLMCLPPSLLFSYLKG